MGVSIDCSVVDRNVTDSINLLPIIVLQITVLQIVEFRTVVKQIAVFQKVVFQIYIDLLQFIVLQIFGRAASDVCVASSDYLQQASESPQLNGHMSVSSQQI